MMVKPKQLIIYFLVLLLGVLIGYQIHQNVDLTDNPIATNHIEKLEKQPELFWKDKYELINIESSYDRNIQKAYFFRSESLENGPLIVSLHSWSGDYTQRDDLAALCVSNDINYIHPDFRGPNNTENACCSDAVMSDIDDAITYAISKGTIDTTRIFIIGVSGGGYATLCSFMKSIHEINTFSAWVPISDLEAWYHESSVRGTKYAYDILACTSSKNHLDENIAEEKSPISWSTPVDKLESSKLYIYAGVNDGIQGSVPITHSINFYNKLLEDLSVSERTKYVSADEKLKLLEFRKPLADYGSVAERAVCLKKEYGNLKLVVFEGNHEMLSNYAFNELIGAAAQTEN